MPKKNDAKKESHIVNSNEFYSDISKEGMLYAVLVRADKIGKIHDTVIDLPDGYVFYTAKDIPGKKEIVINNTAIRIFAVDHTSYIGEPIGIVAGPDEKEVNKILSKIRETFATQIDDETQEQQNKTEENATPQIIASRTIRTGIFTKEPVDEIQAQQTEDNKQQENQSVADEQQAEDAERNKPKPATNEQQVIDDAGKKNAEKSAKTNETEKLTEIDTKTSIALFHANWLEPSGAFCSAKDKHITICTHTKNPVALRSSVAEVLDISENQITIKITKDSPLNKDGLWRTASIAARAAIVAYKTEKPVKLVLSRKDQKEYMTSGMKSTISYHSSVKSNGEIHSMKLAIDVDVGAWNPFAQIFIDRLVIAACNTYSINNILIEANAFTTATPPTSIPLRMMDTQMFFGIETHFSQIAKTLNLMPIQSRLINHGNNKHTELPFLLKHNDLQNMMSLLEKMSDFNRKYLSFSKEIEKWAIDIHNPTFHIIQLRGIGISNAFSGSDYFHPYFSSEEQRVEVTLEEDGIIIIRSPIPILEIKNLWIAMIEKQFEITRGKIKFEQLPTKPETHTPLEMTHGSICILNELFEKCCSEIKRKIRQKATFPITSKKSFSAATKNQWNAKEFKGTPFYSTTFAAAAVEVRVNPLTYHVCVKGIWLVVDCGKTISQDAAERGIRLAIQQQLSNFIEGEIVQCESISISFIQSSSQSSLIGDVIHNTIPAAFCSALSQALNKEITELPYNHSIKKDVSNENKYDT